MKTKRTKKPAGLWSASEVSSWIGITTQGLRNLVAEGVILKEGRGMYRAKETIRAVVDHYRRKVTSSSDSLSADRAREQKARANIAERDDMVAAGKFVPVEACQIVWDAAVTELREAVDGSIVFGSEQKQELTRIAQGIKLEALDTI